MYHDHPILQVALDILELDRALQIAREAVEGGVDWIETGTPLIKSEGMNAVRALKDNFPGHTILADMKTMDTGALEVEMAVKSGADIVILLGSADNSTIADARRAADKYGAKLMCDLISVPDPVARARELEGLGIDIINIHVGIDMQMVGITPIELLRQMRKEIHIPIAVAGGLDATSSGEAVLAGADIVIVGGNIVRSPDVTASAGNIRQNIDAPMPAVEDGGSIEAETRQLLTRVSTPNISDAMHRKGAMTVEAIDTAQSGDVIVIYNGGSDKVAPWGELATLSCLNKGVSGVVIDGAVRDIDDIRRLEFPVFARAVVPNAGEPKGFGEINAEISCAGQTVRFGDYIVGDDNGVVVVPKEQAYEIARRSVEVEKNESRIRYEITRGSTLSKVLRLEKWEKR